MSANIASVESGASHVHVAETAGESSPQSCLTSDPFAVSRCCQRPSQPLRTTGAYPPPARAADPIASLVPEEFQCSLTIPAPGNVTFQHFAFVVHGAPQVVPLTVDLHEDLVQMPPPVRLGTHSGDPVSPELGSEHRTNLFNRNRTVSWLTSIPRSSQINLTLPARILPSHRKSSTRKARKSRGNMSSNRKPGAETGVGGGGGGIRTHGTLSRTPVFKTGAFDHSATSPGRRDA